MSTAAAAPRFERVTVTGGSGLLGRFVVDELAGRTMVTVADRVPPRQSVPFTQLDVRDHAALRAALAGQEAVIHLAAIDDGNPFSDHDYFETNVQGTWNVLDAAESAGVHLVVIASSVASLGLGPDRPPEYLPVDEAHPQRPTATYALTKQVVETVARSFAARGRVRVLCLRPTLIVRPEREAAILAQLDLDDPHAPPPPGACGRGGIEPYGALAPTRTYVRSADAARAFRLALDYDRAPFDVIQLSARDSIGHDDTLARLAHAHGALPRVDNPLRWRRDPTASVLDASRARERLGWEPTGDWRDVEAAHREA
ncbi:MAG: NAD(P)-dependent oxidoreductase [Ectothiorhodospiraceae bacterium]|nr:NAD(P)-dependent oxidoreductase [Chromatiales bacterium]MCP5156979.1 NAD(P)-dependent oxidoreductase [Ectothiorhodospiraceae bacterium]